MPSLPTPASIQCQQVQSPKDPERSVKMKSPAGTLLSALRPALHPTTTPPQRAGWTNLLLRKTFMNTKQCSACGKAKDLSDFNVRPDRKMGYRSECKLCQYSRQEKRAQQCPHRVQAKCKVNEAIKTGRLKKPQYCERCNQSKPLDGHHYDYSQPLSVTWLCRKCHSDIHGWLRRDPSSKLPSGPVNANGACLRAAPNICEQPAKAVFTNVWCRQPADSTGRALVLDWRLVLKPTAARR